MEARLKGKAHHLFVPVASCSENTGNKKSFEWDLNEWRWDGDLFRATHVDSEQLEYRRKQLFPTTPNIVNSHDLSICTPCTAEEVSPGNERGERENEKRRRIPVVHEKDFGDLGGSFDLNLGGQPCADVDVEGNGGKKVKYWGNGSSCPGCQVQGCEVDLSKARDYHRRHKVCEMHSKASEALVRNVPQRFCQQCSRFHVLEEFDEGRRSCRRRLAGHNKRRRKALPDAPAFTGSVPDEKSSSFLLVSLLRMLSNIHLSSLDQMKGQDLLSHLLRNFADTVNRQNSSGLLRETLNAGASVGSQDKINDAARKESADQHMMQVASSAIHEALNMSSVERINLRKIDLNRVCDDNMKGITESSERSDACEGSKSNHHLVTLEEQQDLLNPIEFLPAATSNLSSGHSPSSSSGEDQCRTDCIVFKLFGKAPNDLPIVLRSQILQWLSNSPTDMESYIKPGCIVLTIYFRLHESMWEELYNDLGSSLIKLIDLSSDPFWRSGWIYTRAQDFTSFICDGGVILDTPLPFEHRSCRITSISPIAISTSKSVKFQVKGFNLVMPKSKLFCALEGKYIAQKDFSDLVEEVETSGANDVLQSFHFQCSVPETCGRGFIEVEDYGLTRSFFPFIVAEEDVCCDIRMLESSIDASEGSPGIIDGTRDAAVEFLHEVGWLLHRSRLKVRIGSQNHMVPPFAFGRFKWLLEFSMEHDWCAVMNKLLGILYDGVVDVEEYPSVDAAVSALDLLHVAVRRHSRPMVEFLLHYLPMKQQSGKGDNNFMFKPNAAGACGLTPLHIAASTSGSEHVLDALTDDPLSIGIEAWKTARDSSGLTPNDYASLRGFYSYVNLVQRKINQKSDNNRAQVTVDIPSYSKPKPPEGLRQTKSFGLEGGNNTGQVYLQTGSCKVCERRHGGRIARTSQIARPAMVCMVAVATICVCAALLFKSSPEVMYCFRPFVWDKLPYGAI